MKGLATAVGVLCFTLVSCGVVDVNIPTSISLADFDADFTGQSLRVARTVFSKTTSFKPLKAPYGFITKNADSYTLGMKGEQKVGNRKVCVNFQFSMFPTQDQAADFAILSKGYVSVFSSNPTQYAWVFLCRDGDSSSTTCPMDNIAVYLATTSSYTDGDAAAAQSDFDLLGITGSSSFDFYENDEQPEACLP